MIRLSKKEVETKKQKSPSLTIKASRVGNIHKLTLSNGKYFEFRLDSWPSCCLAGYIHTFGGSPILNEEEMSLMLMTLRNHLDSRMASMEYNVLYGLDVESRRGFKYFSQVEGATVIDVNFNNNSGNNVYLFKYIRDVSR